MQRSADHPEIAQEDIQTLIWGIQAGAKFSDYPQSFQVRVQPLLDAEELATLEVDLPTALSILPGPAQRLASLYGELRARVTDPATSYQELERLAVLPRTPGTRIDVSPWSYVGGGTYLRYLPYGYTNTAIEVYRPAPFHLERDGLGRIVTFASGPYRIETVYDDKDHGEPRVWRLQRLRLVGPAPGEVHVVEVKRGWILPPALVVARADGGGFAAYGPLLAGDPPPGDGWVPTKAELQERWNRAKEHKELYDKWKGYYDKGKELRGEVDRATRARSARDVDDLVDLDHYREGVKAALNPTDLEGKGEWLVKHANRLRDAWGYAVCRLDGCPDGDDDARRADDRLERVDPSEYMAAPANTRTQRLGQSRRPHHKR